MRCIGAGRCLFDRPARWIGAVAGALVESNNGWRDPRSPPVDMAALVGRQRRRYHAAATTAAATATATVPRPSG